MNNPCYNWDRSSWLSSKEYFKKLSNQLIEFLDITEDKKILDVGCGRGHLLETLALNVNLINQPVGVEPVKNEDFISQNVKIYHYDRKSLCVQHRGSGGLHLLNGDGHRASAFHLFAYTTTHVCHRLFGGEARSAGVLAAHVE